MAETLKRIQELIEQNKILEKRNEELKNIIDINLTHPSIEPDIPLIDLIANNDIENLIFKFYHTWKIPIAIYSDKGEILFSIGLKKSLKCNYRFSENFSCLQQILNDKNNEIYNKRYYLHKCSNGFYTIVLPLEVKKGFKTLLVLNQFFYNSEIPDYSAILKFANEINLDEKEVLRMIADIPVFSPAQIETIINQGIVVADMITFIITKNYEFYKRFKQQTNNNVLLNALREKITEQEQIIKKLTAGIADYQKYIKENTINKDEALKEQNKLTQKLARTENILNSILISSPLGICILKKGVITFVNDQIFNLTGYTSKELLGRTLQYILPNDKDWLGILEKSRLTISKEQIAFVSQIRKKNSDMENISGYFSQLHQDKSNNEFILSILNVKNDYFQLNLENELKFESKSVI